MAERRSVLFVVPRFHHNLYVGTKALVEAGYRVRVFALKVVASETHDYISPQRLGDDADETSRAFDEADADLVLIRRAKPLSHQVFRLCRARSVPMVQYAQARADYRPFLVRRISDRLRGWPKIRVTPSPPAAPGRAIAPGVELLPLPVERAGPPGPEPPRGTDGRLRLLCVAKLDEKRKNIPWLIQAIRSANLEGRVRLTLAGSHGGGRSSQEQLRWLRSQASASEWIDIRENVPYACMPDLYRAHDVCILPSFNESFGIAPLEAACYGTVPMITTEAGSVGYVEEGVNGIRVDPRDSRALAAKVLSLAEDPALLTRLSKGARAMTEGPLSPENFVRKIDDLLVSAT